MKQFLIKIKVIHFQRKPRPGFNYSIESIFENLRGCLQDKIDFSVKICGWFNDGYLSKLMNITQAAVRRQKHAIAHITGEVHFLDLLMRKQNVLLTIHDCRFMERKKGLQQKVMGWLYLKAPVKKAVMITAVSENTKRDIISYTGCNPNKIKVIPVSVSILFKPVPRVFNKACPVILQVGAAANKNLERLVEALKELSCKLVIIGEPASDIVEKLHQYKIACTIKTGLTVNDLYTEYINCDIVAFVSTFEGFGMPIIEANCVERPVLTANISSMPEVAGNAACLVDPYSVGSIRKGLEKIIQDDDYRQNLIENGRANSRRFSAEIIADAYYELYKTMIPGL